MTVFIQKSRHGLNTEDRANTIGIITLLVEKKPTGSDCTNCVALPSPPLQATIPNQTWGNLAQTRRRGEVNHSPLNRDMGWIGTGFEKRLGVGKWSMPGTSSQRNGCQDTPSRAIHLYSQTSSIRRQPRQPHRAPSCNLFNPPLKPSAYSPPRSTCHEFCSPPRPVGRVSRNDRVNKTQFE